MDWLSRLHRSGCGVSISHRLPVNFYELTVVLLDFVVSRVTPAIHTRLGYKMFLVFASLNIGAMAPFALCVEVPYFYGVLIYGTT
jgi:hypothetical protein